MNARLVNWVSDAWKAIQESQEHWKFLRDEFSFTVSSAASEYTPAGAAAGLNFFSRWDTDTFRLYSTVDLSDEQHMICEDYDNFRNLYRFGVRQTNRPAVFCIRPRDSAIMLDATPDADYTLCGEYFRMPVILTNDTDTPVIESRFHMAIVYKAMLSYGIDQGGVEVISRAQTGLNDLMPSMLRKYLPEIRL